MTELELRELDRKVAAAIGDRWVPDNPEQPDGLGWFVSKDGSKISCVDGGPDRYSTNWTAMGRLVGQMLKLNWRLTLMTPGGFTDEGLGGGDIETGHWTAHFRLPMPERLSDETGPQYWERVGVPDVNGYATASTGPLAVVLATLDALEGTGPTCD